MVQGLEATGSDGLWPFDRLAAGLLALIAATTLPTRQIPMPAINRATDTDAEGRFKPLRRLSVVVTSVHIALAGHLPARLAAGPAA